MKTIPTILKYMSTTPHSIEAHEALGKAEDLMKTHSIRHLPVMSQGQIKGIVSDRDIHLALSITGVDASRTRVCDIAHTELFLVRPDARLDEVVRLMGEKKIGSVLVVDHHKLVGIFTTIDALHALDELLNTRLAHA